MPMPEEAAAACCWKSAAEGKICPGSTLNAVDGLRRGACIVKKRPEKKEEISYMFCVIEKVWTGGEQDAPAARSYPDSWTSPRSP